MAKLNYRWESPQDWLGDRINALKDKLQNYILRGEGTCDDADHALSDLVAVANGIVNGELSVDADTIQDNYQDEMDADGYFRPRPDPDTIARLKREDCVRLLEGISIECRDEEPVEDLREAVRVAVEDGDIQVEDLPG